MIQNFLLDRNKLRGTNEKQNRAFFITTSGVFRTQTLLNTMLEVSSDRILFSTDYPYESAEEAATWFDSCSISEHDRAKIGRENAAKLFNLKTAA